MTVRIIYNLITDISLTFTDNTPPSIHPSPDPLSLDRSPGNHSADTSRPTTIYTHTHCDTTVLTTVPPHTYTYLAHYMQNKTLGHSFKSAC